MKILCNLLLIINCLLSNWFHFCTNIYCFLIQIGSRTVFRMLSCLFGVRYETEWSKSIV
jgi:hypothetical protein